MTIGQLRTQMTRQNGNVAVSVTTSDGQHFDAVPVVELRAGGMRLSVRAGFGPTDAWVPYAKITSLSAL